MHYVCLDNTPIDYNTFKEVEGALVQDKPYFDMRLHTPAYYLGQKLEDVGVVLRVVINEMDQEYRYVDALESNLREVPLFALKGRVYYPGDTIGIRYHGESKILRRKIKAFEWRQTSPLTAEDWHLETEDGSWYHCWLLTEAPPETVQGWSLRAVAAYSDVRDLLDQKLHRILDFTSLVEAEDQERQQKVLRLLKQLNDIVQEEYTP